MTCPYCSGTKIVKRGLRKKKLESIQLYYCKHCQRKFTPLISKGKTYPLKIILDAICFYNRLYSFEEAAKKVSEKYGITISKENVYRWQNDLSEHLPFRRMREFVKKKYNRREIIEEAKLFHGQIYDFKYHRAKCDLILNEEFRHYKLRPLQEFLELVTAECPHQAFRESQKRASQFKDVFNIDKVKITPKDNFAVKNTRLVLQAVANNKLRHEVLQNFMLVNDSVTVAAEVPVLLDSDDITHYQNHLGFNIPDKLITNTQPRNNQSTTNDQSSDDLIDNSNIDHSLSVEQLNVENCPVITGHIDLVQIRNGAVHILDFKPSAKKQKPVDQLTIYALALSRLTGIRLFNFKCAWFDKDDYFEFYPLHVVYKKKRKRKKR
jgi:transposase-like protein